MATRGLTLSVGFDLQTTLDQVRVMAALYDQWASDLVANLPTLCQHDGEVEPLDETTVLCKGCQRAVATLLTPEGETDGR